MAISGVPVYLSEISSHRIRGQLGTVCEISITFGIFLSQLLSIRELLGSSDRWHILITGPIVPAILSALLLYFLPETPKALLLKHHGYGDVSQAKIALQELRNRGDVDDELKELCDEISESHNKYNRMMGIRDILRKKEFRWPLILSLVLHISQQFSGVNSV